jgi:hypothetical protein
MKFTKRETAATGTGSSDYLKIKPGESVVGVMRGEIFEFHVLWLEGKSQVVKADHPEGKARFKANIFVKDGKTLTPKIWEFGVVVYNQLADISTEYEITETPIKITRQGSGTDTTYMVMPLLKTPLTKDQLNEISNQPLHILGKVQASTKNAPPPAWDESDPGASEELPF